MTSVKPRTMEHWTRGVGRQIVRSLTYRLALSDRALTERLAPHFPLEMQKYLLRLTLLRPRVHMQEDLNRIAIWVEMELRLPGGITAIGHMQANGEVVYIKKKGAFFLSNPDVTDFELRPLPNQYLKPVRYMIRVMLTRFFANNALFQFRQNSWRHRLVRSMVRNVEVRRGKLRVNFHLGKKKRSARRRNT